MISTLFMVLLFVTSVFLILLVLIQRGRGGGLAGAFGGLGGQSAFGTKAGDLFTRVTIFVAAFWIILCAASVKVLNEGSRSILSENLGAPASTAPVTGSSSKAPDSQAPKADGGAAPASSPASGAPESSAGATTAPSSQPAPAGGSEKSK